MLVRPQLSDHSLKQPTKTGMRLICVMMSGMDGGTAYDFTVHTPQGMTWDEVNAGIHLGLSLQSLGGHRLSG